MIHRDSFRLRLTPRALRLAAAGILPLGFALAGCQNNETDSFLWDPSVLGRWERTPTSVPILTRIASIEGPEDDFVEAGEITAQDLIPQIEEYRIGPGDTLFVTLYDMRIESQAQDFKRVVDSRGFLDLPDLGEINLNNKTLPQAKEAVRDAMRSKVAEPTVDMSVEGKRQLRFSVLGAVSSPGPYFIPSADFHLLEALTAAQGFSETAEYIYVIRQIPLTQAAAGKPAPGGPERRPEGAQPTQPERPIDVIEDILKPKPGQSPPAPPAPPPPPPGSPPSLRPSPGLLSDWRQPERDRSATRPPIGLDDSPAPRTRTGGPAQPARDAAMSAQPSGDGQWMFLNGEWVQVRRQGRPIPGAATPAAADEGAAPARPTREVAEPLMAPDTAPGEVVTQRVIKVPIRPLVAGDARYNIVIRPGDVIRVPPPPGGHIYLMGEVTRPGAFGVVEGQTLKQLIASAGGLGPTAIPERTDLIRRVGERREATIRINLRAIAEGTHPDIFMKPHDIVNVGTNFWATPAAIVRNGFRMTYGFGFLLDRNFGNDVFGAPPLNRVGQ